MNGTIRMLRLAIGAVFLLPVYSASAQTGTIIEEMVVTAQRREQSLQDTPVSVTAFSGDAVEKLGMRQSVDITAQTPNFSVGYPNGDTGIPALFIRGVGLSDFRVFTPAAIAPYADDVYIAQNAGQIFQLLDMERVEVLRGPQGTLYGRNATGGAVNYISKKPTEELEAWVRASGGQYGNRKFEGAVSGPLSDRVGARMAVLKNDTDGWMDNRFTGHDQQGIDEFAARALIQADASDSVDLLLNMHGGYTKSDSVQYRHLGVWDALGNQCPLSDIRAGQCVDIFGYSERFPFTTTEGVMGPDARDYDQGNYDLEKENDTKFWGLSLTGNVDVGDFVVTSITAYDDLDDSRPEETDASPNDLLTGVLGVNQETFSQELRVAHDVGRWDWLAGVYYLHDEATDQTGFRVLGAFRPAFVGVDDPGTCADADGIGPPAGNPTGFCPQQFVFTSAGRTKQDITSWSIYGDVSVELTQRVTGNFGVRYTNEEVEHDVREIYDEPAAGNPVRLSGSATESFDSITGRAIFEAQVTDDVMVYGGFSSGFKAGGIDSTVDGIVPYDSEYLINYETGFKTTWADGRLRFNGSLFFYDYSDLQVFTFVVIGAQTFSVLSNASDADIYGAELELQWLPWDRTFVNLGLGYTKAEYKDFVDANRTPPADYSGNQVVMSPELTLNGLVQQDFPLGDAGTITVQFDFNYQDEVFFDAQNNPLLSEDSYWLYNARVGWTSPNERWEVAAWGRNLGDKEYMVYAFDLSFLGFNEEMLGTPRTFGGEASYRF